MDQISITLPGLNTIIGVSGRERKVPQPVNVALKLHLDLQPAGRSDCLGQSVDYSKLVKRVRKAVNKSRFRLIESLAQALADLCLHEERIVAVDVTVEKPQALPGAGVAVAISRRRGAL